MGRSNKTYLLSKSGPSISLRLLDSGDSNTNMTPLLSMDYAQTIVGDRPVNDYSAISFALCSLAVLQQHRSPPTEDEQRS